MKTYETSGFPIVTYHKGYTVTDCRPMQHARWDMFRNIQEIKLLQAKARQERETRTCSDITKKCEQAEAKANNITIKGEADKAIGSLKKSKHPIACKLCWSIKEKKDKLTASINVLEDDMLTQPKEDKANSDIGKVQKALDILNKDIGLANSI